MDAHLHPGPLVSDVLTRQEHHRSADIWTREQYTDSVILHMMHLRHFRQVQDLDPRVLQYIRLAGFGCIYKLGSTFRVDNELITALIERWRPETHTFHFNVGEATITLQDVAVLFGLRVDGAPVTGNASQNWANVVGALLGTPPPQGTLKGSTVRVTWLHDLVRALPDDAPDYEIQCQARIHILLMMGGLLFCDNSGGGMQLLYLPLLADLAAAGQMSWGSTTIAFFYRQLCRVACKQKAEILGPVLLLQLWAWERIGIGRPRCSLQEDGGDLNELRKARKREARKKTSHGSAPPPFGARFVDHEDSLAVRWVTGSYSYATTTRSLKYYRDALDRMTPAEFIWEPYTDRVMQHLAPICQQGMNVWRATVPLICFETVEWHRPERVMRQFGSVQLVPPPCDYDEARHNVDRRGKPDHNWAEQHADMIVLWQNRANSILRAPKVDNPAAAHQLYMAWYTQITRRLISPLVIHSSGVYQSVAPDYHFMGDFVMDSTGRAMQTAQEAHQLYAEHDYTKMLGRVDDYCTYMGSQGSQLLQRASFDPTQYLPPPLAQMGTAGTSASTQAGTRTPPYGGAGGTPSQEYTVFPSYPGGTPSQQGSQDHSFVFPHSTFVAGGSSAAGFRPPPSRPPPRYRGTPPLHQGRIVYQDPCNYYGEVQRPSMPPVNPNLYSQPEEEELDEDSE